MSTYSNRFLHIIEQDELTDKQAMVAELDPGTNPEEFDVDVPDNLHTNTNQVNQQMYGKLESWIKEIDSFLEFINGTGPESMQSILNQAEPDTIFDAIGNSETKKIARVAMEMSSLNEILKGYLASAHSPKYRYV